MTKQEYIKQQYGKAWDAVKDYVDENGWVIHGPAPHSLGFFLTATINSNIVEGNGYVWRPANLKGIEDNNGWRPANLRGIEDNNGWIKVEEKLPENTDLVIVLAGDDQYEAWYDPEYGYWSEDIGLTINPTHWRPKVEYPKPLY
jgi:hypothetical protein